MGKYKPTLCKAVSCLNHFKPCRFCVWHKYQFYGSKISIKKIYERRLAIKMKEYEAHRFDK